MCRYTPNLVNAIFEVCLTTPSCRKINKTIRNGFLSDLCLYGKIAYTDDGLDIFVWLCETTTTTLSPSTQRRNVTSTTGAAVADGLRFALLGSIVLIN